MSGLKRVGVAFALIAAGTLAASSCKESFDVHDELAEPVKGDEADAGDRGTGHPGSDAGAADADSAAPQAAPLGCVPAVAADSLRARSNVMARTHGGGAAGVFTSDLFGLFQSNCGGCHVDNSLGGFQVSLLTFPSTVGNEAFDRATSDDPDFFMPPSGAGGMPFSKRGPDEPISELARLLEAWLAAGRPADVFYPKGGDSGADGENGYLLSEAVGTQMTNIGNCIPPSDMLWSGAGDDEDALDEMFAHAEELPERLEQTDLDTFDAEALAKKGVVAFAPAYTLWADNAKKIRLIRVPRGQSIAFDKDSQSFEIPANTRFYKTFLKHVVDLRGNESYRKMETRLIVSRPDVQLPDGSTQIKSLFGTYAWNEEETEAVLVRDPLRNGQPFRDRLVTYVTDEQAAENVITTGPENLQAALEHAGLTRTYGIPGSTRCVQCHMGAPNKSFVLGFLPVQLNRRPKGEGGVIEAAARDELNQLQRLIDYGVISGMSSPDDVLPLEEAEGDRKPRNEHELEAQGYMLGNCAHCHNPRGYPSTIAPELRELLNFMPSKIGGIFQFPLERFSPRIFRGTFQNVPQPYITPSMYDRRNGTELPGRIDVGPAESNWLPKVVVYAPEDPNDPPPSLPLLAPWRSLIYRNVDTPFTYEEDSSIYPHMPMNTSGYDCRARQLLGSWMVSIPARLKPDPELPPDVSPFSLETAHHEPQPYEEVLPDDPDYTRLKRVGEGQVSKFQKSPRFDDCPDPSTDIVDPAVVRGERLVPKPFDRVLEDEDGNQVGGYSLRTPERPHYAITDLTNPPGDWFPRRPDWSTLLVEQDFDGVDLFLQERVKLLQTVVLSQATELRALATTDVPFGLWQAKPACDFGSMPKVGDYHGGSGPMARPRWMDVTPLTGDEPVYSISPGAQVFGFICANCHGQQADSQGRLAATIADMTGGQTRVANLRDGILGPVASPGSNRERVFGPFATDTITADDWAARYLVFMGLGGTQRTIPTPALQTIRNGTVVGATRPNPNVLSVVSANMLSVPMALCRAVLPGAVAEFVPARGDLNFSETAQWKSPLIEKNGDLELWRRLCAIDNTPVPVRVVTATGEGEASVAFKIQDPTGGSLRHRENYGENPIGDQRGQVRATGIAADNVAPWCFKRPDAEQITTLLEAAWRQHAGTDQPVPYCPDAFVADTTNVYTEADVDRWATRGAMNAGLAVFLYLDALAKGEKDRPVPFDQCEKLNP